MAGFLFGCAFAVGVQRLKVEEHLKPKIHEQIGLTENLALERAITLEKGADLYGAMRVLEEELWLHPTNLDAAIALWDIALKVKEPERGGPWRSSSPSKAWRTPIFRRRVAKRSNRVLDLIDRLDPFNQTTPALQEATTETFFEL